MDGPCFKACTERSRSAGREGLAEWKAEIGDCVQKVFSEALFTK